LSTCLCCCSRATHPRVSAAVGRVSSARTCSWYARLLPPSVLWVGASPPTVVATHERRSSYRLRRRLARLFPPYVFLVRASRPPVCGGGGRLSSIRRCHSCAPVLQPSAPPMDASLPLVRVPGTRVSSFRLCCGWAPLLLPSFPLMSACPPTVCAAVGRVSSPRLCSWYASVLPSSVFLVCASFPLVCTVVGVCPPTVSACTADADAVDTAPCMCRRSCGGGHGKEQRLTDAAVWSQLSSSSVQKTGQSMACDIRTAYALTEKSIHPHEGSYRQQHSKVNCQHTTTERRASGAHRENP